MAAKFTLWCSNRERIMATKQKPAATDAVALNYIPTLLLALDDDERHMLA
jgi:hypothetical protein